MDCEVKKVFFPRGKGRVDRAAFFIDGSNFFKHCEGLGLYAYQLEWAKLLADLASGRPIEYAIYYDAMKDQKEVPQQYAKQLKFHSMLRTVPRMEIRLGRLEWRKDRRTRSRVKVEKGVDVRIATDMITGAIDRRYEVAYLLSADGDFSYVVSEVIARGRRVFVATPGKLHYLRQTASVFITLPKSRLQGYLRRHGGL